MLIAYLGLGPSASWYLTRATGAVTLLLLTISVVLGVSNVGRLQTARWPRFVIERVHRNVSLLAIAILIVHITTSVLDSFVSISWLDAVIPFIGTYRPLWLGLGAFASDLLIALALTSLVRRRLGHRAWRSIHWLAYLCWPVAVMHTVGTGTDVKQAWLLVLTAICVLAVIAAVWARIGFGWPARRPLRGGALAATLALTAAFVVWLPGGPLASGWARRAGTPLSVLNPAKAEGAFSAVVDGNVEKSMIASDLEQVEINLSVANPQLPQMTVTIGGKKAGEALEMVTSTVSLGTEAEPALYSGSITTLAGSAITAKVTDASGKALALAVNLKVDEASGGASGELVASPVKE